RRFQAGECPALFCFLIRSKCERILQHPLQWWRMTLAPPVTSSLKGSAQDRTATEAGCQGCDSQRNWVKRDESDYSAYDATHDSHCNRYAPKPAFGNPFIAL